MTGCPDRAKNAQKGLKTAAPLESRSTRLGRPPSLRPAGESATIKTRPNKGHPADASGRQTGNRGKAPNPVPVRPACRPLLPAPRAAGAPQLAPTDSHRACNRNCFLRFWELFDAGDRRDRRHIAAYPPHGIRQSPYVSRVIGVYRLE